MSEKIQRYEDNVTFWKRVFVLNVILGVPLVMYLGPTPIKSMFPDKQLGPVPPAVSKMRLKFYVSAGTVLFCFFWGFLIFSTWKDISIY
jgi:hypothetical protein